MPLVRKPSSAAPAIAADAGEVLRALISSNPDERWRAARAAGSVPGGIPAMAAALRSETEKHVREALFTSLARTGTAESTTELLSFLRSDQSTLRTGALDGLRAMGSAAGELLPRLFSDADADVRILSCELARALPADVATPALCGLLKDDQDANVCAAAVDVLAEVGSEAALAALARCAARFPNNAFLGFAVKVATDRIRSQSAPARD